MKNTHSKLILSVFLSFALISLAIAQKQAIEDMADRLIETSDILTAKGTVTAFNNYYINNAEVTSRKTRSKVFTDSLGRYEIMVSSGDIITFRARGFEKNRRQVSTTEDEHSVNMILVPGEKNENFAVTYGHMSEQDLASAIEHYGKFNHDFLKYSDMKELLQAELLGTRVVDRGNIQVFIRGRENLLRNELVGPRVTDRQSDKQISMRGGEEIYVSKEPVGTRISDQLSIEDIFERGGDISSSGLSANNGAAIFVVDGLIVPTIDFLSPGEIMSVRLLRNGEAARYGSMGANGVVLINTRHR